MKVNKYLPFAFLYFFFNAVGLPFGLMWTTILAPFFYLWIAAKRKTEILWPFFIVLLPFIVVQTVLTGVDMKSYIISVINFAAVYIFCQAFYTFLNVCDDPELIFRKILIVNFVFCLAGIVAFFTPWDSVFWINQYLTSGISNYRRFKLFTYEASIYATMFVPIFLFFLLQYFLGQNKIRARWLLLFLGIPFVLSFSIGVIGCVLAAIVITVFLYRSLLVKRRVVNMLVNATAFCGSVVLALFLFIPNNTLFVRLANIFMGSDTSTRGRIVDSYILAGKMLHQKNEWWGIGIGQLKLLGHDIVKEYYRYVDDFTATIPSVMAETLALFGWWGIILRLTIEIFLFFYTRVWNSYYRMMLFLFMFVYQFAGSFITNLAEYVIWILAFTNVFNQFAVKVGKKNLQ